VEGIPRFTYPYLWCGLLILDRLIMLNWWERKESNLIPMRVTWVTAKRLPFVLTPILKLVRSAGFEPAATRLKSSAHPYELRTHLDCPPNVGKSLRSLSTQGLLGVV
jgi:hypothetical protein